MRINTLANERPDHARALLMAFLDEHAIPHETVEHPAFFTVEDGRAFKASMPGGHSKNLFLKDKKSNLCLVTAHSDTPIDLVQLGKMIGARGRFSFASADRMQAILGVSPGSVTPFALIHEGASAISTVIVDEALMAFDKVWFHPLVNTASTAVKPEDLLKFIKQLGIDPMVTALPSKEP